MTQIDPRELRNAFGGFLTGVTVVTAVRDDGTLLALPQIRFRPYRLTRLFCWFVPASFCQATTSLPVARILPSIFLPRDKRRFRTSLGAFKAIGLHWCHIT